MGADYYSYAVVGVEIDPDKLYTDEEIRACKCEVDYDENNPPNYCSDCGKKFIKQRKVSIQEYNEDEMDLLGFQVIYSTNRERAFVGAVAAGCNDYSDKDAKFLKFPSLDLNKIKEELKNKLGHRFWDEKKFGLYSVLFCSY